MSWFDELEQAEAAYKRRHAAGERFTDDCCQCVTCRSDLAGIAPCDSDASLAEDPQGLSREAVAARAEGIAQDIKDLSA